MARFQHHVRKTKPNHTDVIARLEDRRNFLYKTCKQLGLDEIGNDSLHRPNSWEFLINHDYGLVWCNVFKAASTSWMYNFNILAGYSPKFLKRTKAVPLSLARKKYPRPSVEFLKKSMENYFSFIIVRHPLERLLSAYRDKLQFALPLTYHKQLGNNIIKQYRKPKPSKRTPTHRWPTFAEFVAYLLDCRKRGDRLDMHWTPITEFCTPCMFKFDVVAKIETLDEDQQYVIEKAGLKEVLQSQWKNAGHGPTSDHVAKYYAKLKRSDILRLYKLYKYDFQLFNYSIKEYLEFGQPDEKYHQLLLEYDDLTELQELT